MQASRGQAQRGRQTGDISRPHRASTESASLASSNTLLARKQATVALAASTEDSAPAESEANLYERLGRPATPWHGGGRESSSVSSSSTTTTTIAATTTAHAGAQATAARVRSSAQFERERPAWTGQRGSLDIAGGGNIGSRASEDRNDRVPSPLSSHRRSFTETTTTYTFPDPFVAKEALKALREAEVGRRAVPVPVPKSQNTANTQAAAQSGVATGVTSETTAVAGGVAEVDVGTSTASKRTSRIGSATDHITSLRHSHRNRVSSFKSELRLDTTIQAEPDLVSSPVEMSPPRPSSWLDQDGQSHHLPPQHVSNQNRRFSFAHETPPPSSGMRSSTVDSPAAHLSSPVVRSYSDSQSTMTTVMPVPMYRDSSAEHLRPALRGAARPVSSIAGLTSKPLPAPPSALRSHSRSSSHDQQHHDYSMDLPAPPSSLRRGGISLSSLRRSLPPILTGSSRQQGSAPLRLRSDPVSPDSPELDRHAQSPPSPGVLPPSSNLAGYLANAVFDRWEHWPDPATFAHSPTQSLLRDRWRQRKSSRGDRLGSPSAFDGDAQAGRRAVIARLVRDVERTQAENGGMTRTLRSWRPPSDFFHRVQNCKFSSGLGLGNRADDTKVIDRNIPSRPIPEAYQWNNEPIFAIPSPGFQTVTYHDEASARAEDAGLLGWITGALLATTLSVLHMLRYNAQSFAFFIVPESIARSNAPNVGIRDFTRGGEARQVSNELPDGCGTLVLVNKDDQTDRPLVLLTRPPWIADGDVLREFASEKPQWHTSSTSRLGDNPALLLQTEVFDACVLNNCFFFCVTNLKHAVFGSFDGSYSTASVSPVILRRTSHPSFMEVLSVWVLKAFDERPRNIGARDDPGIPAPACHRQDTSPRHHDRRPMPYPTPSNDYHPPEASRMPMTPPYSGSHTHAPYHPTSYGHMSPIGGSVPPPAYPYISPGARPLYGGPLVTDGMSFVASAPSAWRGPRGGWYR